METTYSLFQLFLIFFYIGAFTIGGGLVAITLMQQTLVDKGVISAEQFYNMVAISESTPGPIGINSATYCGYTAVHNAGYGSAMAALGSAVATFALVLPSLIMMILISKMFMKYMNTAPVQNIFAGLRPAVVGLLAAAALLLMTPENFSSPDHPWQFCISIGLFIATFVGTKIIRINPIRMIGYAAVAGLLLLY